MTGEKRRKEILQALTSSNVPQTASFFAEKYEVSRQVIVGDVALLRAEGIPITATNKGYIIEDRKNIIQIVVTHNVEQTQEELEVFVKHGIEVLDVTVEHAIYGELSGRLDIKNSEDIIEFLSSQHTLLSSLTEGIHMHRIRYPNEAALQAVLDDLRNHNFLYKN